MPTQAAQFAAPANRLGAVCRQRSAGADARQILHDALLQRRDVLGKWLSGRYETDHPVERVARVLGRLQAQIGGLRRGGSASSP